MKKLLTLLGGLGIAATVVTPIALVSCGIDNSDSKIELKSSDIKNKLSTIANCKDINEVNSKLLNILSNTPIDGVQSLTAALKIDTKSDIIVSIVIDSSKYKIDKNTIELNNVIVPQDVPSDQQLELSELSEDTNIVSLIGQYFTIEDIQLAVNDIEITGIENISISQAKDTRNVTFTLSAKDGYSIDGKYNGSFTFENMIPKSFTVDSIENIAYGIEDKYSTFTPTEEGYYHLDEITYHLGNSQDEANWFDDEDSFKTWLDSSNDGQGRSGPAVDYGGNDGINTPDSEKDLANVLDPTVFSDLFVTSNPEYCKNIAKKITGIVLFGNINYDKWSNVAEYKKWNDDEDTFVRIRCSYDESTNKFIVYQLDTIDNIQN